MCNKMDQSWGVRLVGGERQFWNFGTRSPNSIPCATIRLHCHTSLVGSPEKPGEFENQMLQKHTEFAA